MAIVTSISKSCGQKIDHDNLDFCCPVCSDATDSAETVEVTINSHASLIDSLDIAIPSAVCATASDV